MTRKLRWGRAIAFVVVVFVMMSVFMIFGASSKKDTLTLARVIAIRPEVMLLDEPTANLDPYSVRVFEDAVVRMNRDFGTTVVIATHDVFCAKRLADRVIFVCDGRIVEDGKALRVFSKPKDERTKRFLSGEIV